MRAMLEPASYRGGELVGGMFCDLTYLYFYLTGVAPMEAKKPPQPREESGSLLKGF